MVCQEGNFGTNKLTASGGAGGGTGGGAGAVGRIAIHHSKTIVGTTSPAFTDVEDTTLKEKGGGAWFGIV